ncbi:hypothetical protein TUMEXPCC7403_16950 [Tumidithrix helvetica PCC 7403]|uniref:hypothetical protein n=1 Tax=Tumidithrix helvetica TaxID=3457545 RepID=UPI003C8C8234
MYSTDTKSRLNITIDSGIDEQLRVLSARHRGSTLSSIVEDALRHCLENRHFLERLKAKHEKEPQY